MLPSSLAGSYQQYKEDTTVFTTWLAKTAIACGYTMPPQASADHSVLSEAVNSAPAKRRKGKAKKVPVETYNMEAADPRPSVTYIISTRELVKQAEIVAEKRKRGIPQGVKRIVNRAIDVRQRCADWYKVSEVKNAYSDEGHQFFIDALKSALSILDPVNHENGPTPPKDSSDLSWTELHNKFQQLELEERHDIDDDSEYTDSEDTNQTIYELEEECIETKMSLMIFSFFEDLHRIQSFLGDIWTKYKARDVDLSSASLITNIAIQLVRQSEKEVLAAAPQLFDRKKPYSTIAIVIFYANAFSEGQDPAQRLNTNDSLKPTPFDDFIYLSTARILMKLDHASEMPKKFGWPVPMFPLRFSYISRPGLLATPYMKEKQKEDVILSQYIHDHFLYNGLYQKARKMAKKEDKQPVEDEFTQSLREVVTKDVISVTSVFACQIFLDIVKILGKDVKRGYNDLLSMTAKIDKALWSTGSFSDKITTPVFWLTKETDTPVRLHDSCVEWGNHSFSIIKELSVKKLPRGWDQPDSFDFDIKPSEDDHAIVSYTKDQQENAKLSNMRGVQLPKAPKFSNVTSTILRVPDDYAGSLEPGLIDPELAEQLRIKCLTEAGITDHSPVSAEAEANAKLLDLKPVQPNPDLEYLYTHNPIYCGLAALQISVDFEEAGLTLANYHVVPILVVYLYSEVKRTKLLSLDWPEIEKFTDMHTTELFGGQRPRSAAEAFIKFSKTLAMSTSGPPKRHQRSLPYKEPSCIPQPVSSALQPYFQGKENFAVCISKLEAQAQARREEKFHTSKHKRRENRRKLTPYQFLTEMQHLLADEVPRLQSDYVALTKTCYKLMKQIHTEIKTTADCEYPLHIGGDTMQPYYPLMVQGILDDSRQQHAGGRNSGQSPQLEAVARVLNKYLEIKARLAALSS